MIRVKAVGLEVAQGVHLRLAAPGAIATDHHELLP